jgi:hypothetical protein
VLQCVHAPCRTGDLVGEPPHRQLECGDVQQPVEHGLEPLGHRVDPSAGPEKAVAPAGAGAPDLALLDLDDLDPGNASRVDSQLDAVLRSKRGGVERFATFVRDRDPQ